MAGKGNQLASLELFAQQVNAATGMNVALLDNQRHHLLSIGDFEGSLFNFFLYENLYDRLEQLQNVDQPMLFSDRLDFNWLAEWMTLDNDTPCLTLLGPAFYPSSFNWENGYSFVIDAYETG